MVDHQPLHTWLSPDNGQRLDSSLAENQLSERRQRRARGPLRGQRESKPLECGQLRALVNLRNRIDSTEHPLSGLRECTPKTPAVRSFAGFAEDNGERLKGVILVQLTGEDDVSNVVRRDGSDLFGANDEAVELAIYKEGDANTVSVSKALNTRIANVGNELPEGIEA